MRRIIPKMVACVVAFSMVGTFVADYDANAETSVVEESIITSDELEMHGYQVKIVTDNEGNVDIGFRAIAKGPHIGSTITVGEKEYEIAELGTIYALDSDCSGNDDNKVLDETYMILDKETFADDGALKSYRGIKKYEGVNYTFGYIATEAGMTTIFGQDDPEHTYYVRTIIGMNELIANTIQVRNFAVATDGTLIYSERVYTTSIAEIANTLYVNGKMQSKEAHDEVFKYILNGELLERIHENNPDYPYYRTEQVEYGWSSVVPGDYK